MKENKEEDKNHTLTDLESGLQFKVSKEQKENYLNSLRIIRPELIKGNNMVPLLTGTGGENCSAAFTILNFSPYPNINKFRKIIKQNKHEKTNR